MPIFRNPNLDPNAQVPADPPVDPATTGSIRPGPGVPMMPKPRGGVLGSMYGNGGGSGWGGGYDDDPRSRVAKIGALLLMMDKHTANAGTAMLQLQQNRASTNYALKRQNYTADWLKTQGMGEQEAAFVASDPDALKEWYKQRTEMKTPKWEMHEVYNAQHQKVQVLMDMHTGKFSPVGGSAPPNMEITDIYDEQSGMKRKAIINKDDPLQAPIFIGGEDTGVVSDKAEEQKIRIARAGAPPAGPNAYDVETQGKEGFGGRFNAMLSAGDDADSKLSRLDMMEAEANDKNFNPGGGEGTLRAKQWAQFFGFKQEGIEKMEDFSSQANALALDMMGGKLGAGFSNADRDFIKSMMPSLTNTKGGIKTMIQVQRALAQRAQQMREMALDYVDDPSHPRIDAGFIRQMKQWSEANPVFGPLVQKTLQEQAKQPDDPGASGGGGGVPPPSGQPVTMPDGTVIGAPQ
jgi:hypothetical protein